MKKNQNGVAPTLKSLPVFEKAIFQLTQYTVVNAAIQRIQTETGKKFTQRKNKENKNLEVIRTA